MSTTLGPCPWGPNPIDLRRRELTLSEKKWLASAFITGEMTAKDLHEKYKVAYSALHKYVKQVKNGGVLYDKPGQPRKLDKTSMLALVNILKTTPEIEDSSMRDSIRNEYRETLKRRFPDEAEVDRKKRKALSYASVVNYSTQLRAYVKEHASDLPSTATGSKKSKKNKKNASAVDVDEEGNSCVIC
jgi:transposase